MATARDHHVAVVGQQAHGAAVIQRRLGHAPTVRPAAGPAGGAAGIGTLSFVGVTVLTHSEAQITGRTAIEGAQSRCRRVGHSIVKPGLGLAELGQRLELTAWDMVELDVLAHDGELLVAHDLNELGHVERIPFIDALTALRDLLPGSIDLNVDIKAPGYELAVLEALRSLDLADRSLVSTMEVASLRVLRAAASDLRLGLSIPRVRRNYLAHPLTRPGAYLMLAALRRALPRRVAAALRSGLVNAIMAHWGVVTPQLVDTVRSHGGELYVWTVDDAARLDAVQRLGVTGVITNDRALFDAAAEG